MSDFDPEISQILNGSGYSPTSNVPSDAPHSFRRKPVRTSINVVANAARAALGLRDEEQVFELPGGCSNNCRLPFMFVTGMVSFFGTIDALPNSGAGRLNPAIPMNGFADRIECFAPAAVCFRTINTRWRMCSARRFRARTGSTHRAT
jgi:hypothetical protein